VALLTDGELVNGTTARLGEGVRLTEGTLRPRSGRLIAVTPDRRLVAVLLATTRSREVVVLTARDLPITARVQLPVGDTTSATTLVAPVNDRLVVLGARETQKGGHLPVGWVIELPRGDVSGRWSIQKPPRGNWTVFDAAAAPDAKRLYLSYHGTCNGGPGACTTGVDVVAWKSGRPLCRARPNSLAGCIAAMHGESRLSREVFSVPAVTTRASCWPTSRRGSPTAGPLAWPATTSCGSRTTLRTGGLRARVLPVRGRLGQGRLRRRLAVAARHQPGWAGERVRRADGCWSRPCRLHRGARVGRRPRIRGHRCERGDGVRAGPAADQASRARSRACGMRREPDRRSGQCATSQTR
jgi:hypothetical protein